MKLHRWISVAGNRGAQPDIFMWETVEMLWFVRGFFFLKECLLSFILLSSFVLG